MHYTDVPVCIFVIYEYKNRLSPRADESGTTYTNQILSHILPGVKTLKANEIRKMMRNNYKWSQIISFNRKPKVLDNKNDF